MTSKIELGIYALVLSILWIACMIIAEDHPMKLCEQTHSHDVCFTSIYK